MDERSRIDRILWGEYKRQPMSVAEKIVWALCLIQALPLLFVLYLSVGPIFQGVAGVVIGAWAIRIVVRWFNAYASRREHRPPD